MTNSIDINKKQSTKQPLASKNNTQAYEKRCFNE